MKISINSTKTLNKIVQNRKKKKIQTKMMKKKKILLMTRRKNKKKINQIHIKVKANLFTLIRIFYYKNQ